MMELALKISDMLEMGVYDNLNVVSFEEFDNEEDWPMEALKAFKGFGDIDNLPLDIQGELLIWGADLVDAWEDYQDDYNGPAPTNQREGALVIIKTSPENWLVHKVVLKGVKNIIWTFENNIDEHLALWSDEHGNLGLFMPV